MKTVQCILTEFRKVVISPYFLIGVLAFALMCFTSPAYMDFSVMKQISIFEMLTMPDLRQAENYEFSAQYVCSKGFGTWIVQFLGIIVAFPFVKVLCEERRCSEKRYIICRTGIFRYSLSKFLSAIFSAAILCTLGYLLFSTAVYLLFPGIGEFPAEQVQMLASFRISYLKLLIETVIMGMGMSVLPFLTCVFTTNQYFCICVPFLLQYIQLTAANKLFIDGFENYPKWQQTLIQAIYPASLGSLVYGLKQGIVALLGYVWLAVAAFVLFTISQRRCTDCGR